MGPGVRAAGLEVGAQRAPRLLVYVYRRTHERFCDLKFKSIRESAWNFKQNGNIQCFLVGTENLKREDESFRFRQGWLNKRLKVWITESRQFLMRVLNCGG